MATSSFNIDAFTSKLTHGGALASLFECELTGQTGGQKGSIDTWTFMCKGVTFPASAIDVATVTYMGRALNIPSNRAAAQLTTSVYNDENMDIRNHVENWMERLNSHKSNKRNKDFKKILDYTATMKVRQLKKDGSGDSKQYVFNNVWPSSTGEITLSWDTNEIQTFDITWEYSYWASKNSLTGQS